MPEISVIMPSLNMARYYEECMDSVLCQTFKDFEVLAVDAGSMDGTLEMIERYQEQDERVHLLRSPVKSYGYQMNMAIDAAAGAYICIVETDDCIEPDMLECLHDAAVETGADYAKGTGVKFYRTEHGPLLTDEVKGCPVAQEKERVVVEPCRTPECFHSDNFLWNGLYKRELLRGIRFHETKGAAFQDIGVLFRLMHAAKRAVFVDHVVYRYRQDNEMASSYNPKSLAFTRYEYEALLPFVKTCTFGWQAVYYKKMLGLTLNRFQHMSLGSFWPGIANDTAWLRAQIKGAIEEGFFTEDIFSGAKYFLHGDRDVYELFRQRYLPQAAEPTRVLKACQASGAIIFGCGKRGQELRAQLDLLHVPVRAFADNDAKKQGTKVADTIVWSAEEAVREAGDAHFLIANAKYAEEIRVQLLTMDVPLERCHITKPIKDMYVLRLLYHRLAQ